MGPFVGDGPRLHSDSFFGLLEHGFDSGSQLGWLFIEATLAVALLGPLNLHRKRLQDEPS